MKSRKSLGDLLPKLPKPRFRQFWQYPGGASGQSGGDILARPDTSPASLLRPRPAHQKALARMADRPGVRYAVTVENPNIDPVS